MTNDSLIKPPETNQSSTPQFTYVQVENPGANITQTLFNGNNYDDWSQAFHLALTAKGKEGYVDGTIKKPSDGTLASWRSQNALVTAWIYNSIEPSLRKSITRRSEAHQVWSDIRSRFFQNNDARLYRLQADLMACKQASNESLMTYYGRLINLWDDLLEADPLPSCPCDPCTCTWVSIIDERRERQRVREFLMGLNDTYDNARSQILALSPLPNLNTIYNRLLQEESMKAFTITKSVPQPDTMAYAARVHHNPAKTGGRRKRGSRQPNPNDPRPWCIACLRHGHLYTSCFRYTGKWPEYWGDRPRDRIYINEKDMSRTVVPDVEGRARYEQLKKTGASSSSNPPAGPRVHMVGGPSNDICSSGQLDKIDLNNLSPTAIKDIKLLLESRKPTDSIEHLNGYPYGKKGWRVYDIETRTYFSSRDVVFIENEFPFKALPTSNPTSTIVPSLTTPFDDVPISITPSISTPAPDATPDPTPSSPSIPTSPDTPQTPPSNSAPPLTPSAATTSPTPETNNSATSPPSTSSSSPPPESDTHDTTTTQPLDLGKGQRPKFPNSRLKDYHQPPRHPSTHMLTASSSTETRYPLSHFISYNQFSTKHKCFLAAVTKNHEPSNFRDAMQDPQWKKAMKSEVDALERNKTWTLVDLPPNKKAIGSKWVYRIKYNANGTIERYKARLVVMGNRQVEGVDFNETFAPTAKMVTVRTLFAIAAAKGWALHQMDVHNAFLHGDLNEEVYMKPPPGFSDDTKGKVCRLQKSLYGLKQAPRCWYAKLASALKQYGFIQCPYDHSLFSINKTKDELHVLIYVDDLVICGNNQNTIEKFKAYLSKCFHMKDLGILKYFLGLEIARSKEGSSRVLQDCP
ncbi:uncharacterized protein LOC141614050 [Silene latifolia]|uniref:uncharacterized protein LOC141614050 n=1 Tax=Silene latifolia TaxID=37657 RepID=UPI003D7783A1